MAYTEVTTESWGSRLGSSIKSVLVGLVLFVISFPLLFWNEGRAVQTAKSLSEGAAAVVSVPADKVDALKEGRLVHTSGLATTDEVLKDPAFNVSAKALKLSRDVEMYQWEETKKSETKKNVGGSTTTQTTYDYRQTWSSRAINSGSFKQPEGHRNPGSLPYSSNTLTAKNVTLGAFTLTAAQVEKISGSSRLAVEAAAAEGLPTKASVSQGTLYLGADPASPQIGDTKVSFTSVAPTVVTLVAQQAGSSFAPFQTGAGDALLLVKDGQMTAAEIFKAAEADNEILTWILRVIGWVLMFAGLMAVFKPIAVFGDVVPFFGSMLGAGLGLFAFLVSMALSLLTLSVAWIFYRPLLGIALLIVAGGALFGLIRLAAKKKAAAPAPARAA